MEELKKLREEWSKAYLSADIEALQSIESPLFIAISAYGIEEASDRYDLIYNKHKAGNWFKSSAESEDIKTTYIKNGNTCQVVGTGRIVAKGKVIRHSHFSELWFKTDGEWNIHQIHVSQVN